MVTGQFALAQQTPAPPQTKGIVVSGATAHLGNGEVIENSIIAFENGKFTVINTQAVGQGFDGFETIDATGKHIYPGFIAPNTQLGLKEIDAVRSTRDDREVGYLKPHVRSIIAYNTDSRVTPTVRSNGVLLAQISPTGGRIKGSSSIVELDAWNWEDAAYSTDDAIHLSWPSMFRRTGWWAEPGGIKKNDKYKDQVRDINNFFKEALAYTKKTKVESKNLKFEAMRGVFNGSKNLIIATNAAKTITEAILFAKEFDITPVILGGKEAWKIADFLKTNNISIILSNTQSLPSNDDDHIDQPFKSALALQKVGVPFCFSMGGAWEQRNLPFQAGQAVAFGLDYEAAISGLTLNTAKILKIDKTVGSIESGKDATFFIAEGDALDMRTCKVTKAFIRGKEIDVDNKQKALYRKFKAKYENDKK